MSLSCPSLCDYVSQNLNKNNATLKPLGLSFSCSTAFICQWERDVCRSSPESTRFPEAPLQPERSGVNSSAKDGTYKLVP